MITGRWSCLALCRLCIKLVSIRVSLKVQSHASPDIASGSERGVHGRQCAGGMQETLLDGTRLCQVKVFKHYVL